MRRRFDISESELLLVMTKLGWALLLLLPVRVFDGPSYQPMAETAPEWAWGLVALIICAIVLSGALEFSQNIQIFGLALAGMWWGYIAGMFWVTDTVPTGTVVYGIMSLVALWRVFARISGYSPLKYATRQNAKDNVTYGNVTDGTEPPPNEWDGNQ